MKNKVDFNTLSKCQYSYPLYDFFQQFRHCRENSIIRWHCVFSLYLQNTRFKFSFGSAVRLQGFLIGLGFSSLLLLLFGGRWCWFFLVFCVFLVVPGSLLEAELSARVI